MSAPAPRSRSSCRWRQLRRSRASSRSARCSSRRPPRRRARRASSSSSSSPSSSGAGAVPPLAPGRPAPQRRHRRRAPRRHRRRVVVAAGREPVVVPRLRGRPRVVIVVVAPGRVGAVSGAAARSVGAGAGASSPRSSLPPVLRRGSLSSARAERAARPLPPRSRPRPRCCDRARRGHAGRLRARRRSRRRIWKVPARRRAGPATGHRCAMRCPRAVRPRRRAARSPGR